MQCLLDITDKIYCINLDRRTDRWQSVIEEFTKIGLKDKVERVSAVEASPGIKGCTFSHYNIIKQAKENKYKSILIFEDDVEFIRVDEFEATISNALLQLQNLGIDYDMFYLGGNVKGTQNKKVSNNLVELNNVKTTHAYIVTEKMYDIILNIFDSRGIHESPSWDGGDLNRLNIDFRYATDIAPHYNVYGVWPMLAKQAAGISDLDGNFHEYKLDEKWEKLTYGN
jgi:GR25 family glycosyltransferase involved in LPS biosynthesis|tara:strand:- start:12861 stop:13538 length:678 start_codon:yes stop_codon:yes gene_type:complete